MVRERYWEGNGDRNKTTDRASSLWHLITGLISKIIQKFRENGQRVVEEMERKVLMTVGEPMEFIAKDNKSWPWLKREIPIDPRTDILYLYSLNTLSQCSRFYIPTKRLRLFILQILADYVETAKTVRTDESCGNHVTAYAGNFPFKQKGHILLYFMFSMAIQNVQLL